MSKKPQSTQTSSAPTTTSTPNPSSTPTSPSSQDKREHPESGFRDMKFEDKFPAISPDKNYLAVLTQVLPDPFCPRAGIHTKHYLDVMQKGPGLLAKLFHSLGHPLGFYRGRHLLGESTSEVSLVAHRPEFFLDKGRKVRVTMDFNSTNKKTKLESKTEEYSY